MNNLSDSTKPLSKRLSLVLFFLSTIVSTTTLAETIHASVGAISKGSIHSDISHLNNVDGDVAVVFTDDRGNFSGNFLFQPSNVASPDQYRLTIDIYEQTASTFSLSISNAKRNKFSRLPMSVTCAQSLCTSFKVVIDLTDPLSSYVKNNEVLVRLTARKAKGARLLIDSMSLESETSPPPIPPTPLVSIDDNITTDQDTAVIIAVLENDSAGVGSNSISIGSLSNPSNGTAQTSGSFVIYTPNTGFVGTDQFVYNATDSLGNTDNAQVTIVVTKATTPVVVSPASFSPGSSHYWQLQGSVSTTHNASVYGIDLEDNENTGLVDTLKAQSKQVVCYISAGSYEQWRSDAGEFDQNNDLGNPLGDWPGEFYLNIKSDNVRRIMRSRIDRAVAANCDALEPDNTDAYQASNGLGLTSQDQVDYLLFLANYAHSKGLSIGLKNTVDLIADANLADKFDFTLNESCYVYNECDALKPFIDANKAVYIAMYGVQSKTTRCNDAEANQFHLAFYNSDYLLDGSTYETCQ